MFRIQRSANGRLIVFTLSGRIRAAGLAELQRLLESESGDHNLALDLNEVKLVDRDAITFLAACEAKGVKLTNCPAFIREWIEKETA
jgi:anti-anti-sigma regulatory factor